MEVSYGIGVKNRYALFMADENADPLDLMSKPIKDKDTSSKGLPATNETAKVDSSDSRTTSAAPVKDNQLSQGKGRTVNKGKSNDHQEAKGGSVGNKERSGNTGQGKEILNGERNSGNREQRNNRSERGGRGGRSNNPGGFQDGGRGGDHDDNGGRRFNPNRGKENRGDYEGRGERREGRGRFDHNRGERRNRDEGGHYEGRENREQRRDFKDSGATESNKTDTWASGDWNTDVWNTSTAFGESSDKKPRDRDREGDREARGSRGGRGRGGFRGRGRGRGSYDGRGKREYDRHSGSDKTSIKPVEKRDGSGSYNWGNVQDWSQEPETQTLDETQDNAEEKKESKMEEWAPGEESKEEGDKTDDEQSKVELSYDEWKKQEEEKRVVPKWNIRKPGEGEENNPEYKKGNYVLKKKDDDNADDDEYEEVEIEIRHGREKKLLDIEINFKDENRDMRRGRGRGGPRGGRGGSGRGGRGERDGERPDRRRGRDGSKQSAPKVDDMEAFPSLNA